MRDDLDLISTIGIVGVQQSVASALFLLQRVQQHFHGRIIVGLSHPLLCKAS